MHKNTYILFTRYPRAGETKTRLIPALGALGAARVQKEMTEHIFGVVRSIMKPGDVLRVCYSDASEQQMKWWLGEDDHLQYHVQSTSDIGVKMRTAFEDAFADGSERCVLLGADCPDITEGDLSNAMDMLLQKDVVLGPARDGGYYLVGMARSAFEKIAALIFSDMAWSTDTVFSQTVKRIASTDLCMDQLSLYSDADEPEDLAVWERISAQKKNEKDRIKKVSVIIPTFNEEAEIGKTIEFVLMGEDVECIVVDGGSTDRTMALARHYGARTYKTDGGRSAQLNFGAKNATGEYLLFLHADTHVSLCYDRMIRRSFAEDDLDCSAFNLYIRGDHFSYRAVEYFANLRSRLFHLPYGDQGICVRKTIFDDLGGFPQEVIMEDYIFMRSLHKKKLRCQMLPMCVCASSRRWDHLGVVRTTLINQIVVMGYYFGIPLETLAQWYHKKR